MRMPWVGKTGLAKAAALLAVVLLVSLGLCGVNFGLVIAFGRFSWAFPSLAVTAYLELAGIIASAAGLLVVGVIGVVMAVIRMMRGEE
jgi:hypothetical protein